MAERVAPRWRRTRVLPTQPTRRHPHKCSAPGERKRGSLTYVTSDDTGYTTVDEVMGVAEDSLKEGQPAERADEGPYPNDVLGRFWWRLCPVTEPSTGPSGPICQEMTGGHGGRRQQRVCALGPTYADRLQNKSGG